MEIRINVALLSILAVAWVALSPSDPVAAMDPGSAEAHELARLEDRFAADSDDVVLARRLATTYLELDRPGLAIAALRSAEPQLLEDAVLSHKLAQAYEQSGRMLDALATADLAVARCARSLGTADSSAVTPIPRYGCDERDYAVMEMHRTALSHMVRWGVSDPETDSRSRLAYDLAMRRARVASAAQ